MIYLCTLRPSGGATWRFKTEEDGSSRRVALKKAARRVSALLNIRMFPVSAAPKRAVSA